MLRIEWEIEELKAAQENALRREELNQCLAALTAQFWQELPNAFRLLESELTDLKLKLYVSDSGKYGRIDLPGVGRAVTILSPETIVREVGKQEITLRVLPPKEAPFKTEIKIGALAVPVIFHVDSALSRHNSTLSAAASGSYPFAGFYRFLWCSLADNQKMAASLVGIIRGEQPKSDFDFEPLSAVDRQGHSRFIATEIYGPDTPETEMAANGRYGKRNMILLRVFAWPIAMLVWTVAGLYVWIPAIVIGVLFFLASIFIATFTDNRGSMISAEEWLREIFHIYPAGFVSIHRMLLSAGDEGESSEKSKGRTPAAGNRKNESTGNFISFCIVAGVCLGVATLSWYLLAAFLDEIL